MPEASLYGKAVELHDHLMDSSLTMEPEIKMFTKQ